MKQFNARVAISKLIELCNSQQIIRKTHRFLIVTQNRQKRVKSVYVCKVFFTHTPTHNKADEETDDEEVKMRHLPKQTTTKKNTIPAKSAISRVIHKITRRS